MKAKKSENISQEGFLNYCLELVDKYIYYVLICKKIKSQLSLNS